MHGTQPGIGVLAQLPALHASVVHALPSSQSAGVVQGGQPGSGVCVQPSVASQASVVHGLPSSQLGGVPGWQPAAPPHVSAPLQKTPSSQSASPPSSTWPSQLLSIPSHTSGVPATGRTAEALAATALVAEAVTTVVPPVQASAAVPLTRTVSVAPMGSAGTRTLGGSAVTTVGVTLVSSAEAVTWGLETKGGTPAAVTTTPLAASHPPFSTVNV